MTEAAKNNVVFIDDKELKVKDFDDRQKYFHAQILDLRNKRAKIEFDLDQVNASLSVFEKAFTETFKTEEE